MKINLTAANKQEELILAYLQENASETLADKIMLRACALNKPNVTNGKIEVGGKFYTSNR